MWVEQSCSDCCSESLIVVAGRLTSSMSSLMPHPVISDSYRLLWDHGINLRRPVLYSAGLCSRLSLTKDEMSMCKIKETWSLQTYKSFCLDSQQHLTTKILCDMVPLWQCCIRKVTHVHIQQIQPMKLCCNEPRSWKTSQSSPTHTPRGISTRKPLWVLLFIFAQ